jgi:putative DNA primase/helicase
MRGAVDPEAAIARLLDPAGGSPNGAAPNGTGTARPRLNAGRDDYAELAVECWDALARANDPPVMFSANGALVRLDRQDDALAAHTLDAARLAHELTRAADWYKVVKAGRESFEVPSSPKDGVVRDMLASRSFPLPALDRVVSCPIFGPDGSLRTEPGYHAASRTYFDGSLGLRAVPEEPSDAEIAAALDLILGELLCDFPFVADSDRAHAIGELLLPFVRAMVRGPCPLHVHEAPTRGTGKDLLAEVMCRVATGADPATLGYSERSEEFVKRLVSTLRPLPEWVVIPNVSAKVENDDLTDVISRGEYHGRLLGASEILRLPARNIWTLTSNNAQLTPDMARRSVRVRMDAHVERPEQRIDFRHADLKAWTIEERAELAWSCLTIVRGWIAAGMPDGGRTLGGFTRWARTVGGIVAFAGFGGFLDEGDREEFLAQADAGTGVERIFVALWWEKFGPAPVGLAALYPVAMDENVNLDIEARTAQGARVKLGIRLRQMRDRRYRVDADTTVTVGDAGTLHRGVLWKLTRDDDG